METELFLARINDIANQTRKSEKPKFLGFLSSEQAFLAKQTLEKQNIKFDFFGGYPNAQRKVLACLPDWAGDTVYPITAVTFRFRKTDVLKHRDFLGAILGLGLKRESVGDILIEEGRAIVFLLDEICDYVLTQIEKIGRTGVKATFGFEEPLPESETLAQFSETVASLRLDCVVSSLANVSRAESTRLIELGLVSINSMVCSKTVKTVNSGDILTIRGKGKFIIDDVSEKSRKNRIILRYKKYI